MTMRQSVIPLIIIIFLALILISGNAYLRWKKNPVPPQPVSPVVFTNNTSPDDFSITISRNGFGNITDTLSKKFPGSWRIIQTDIPVLLDLAHTTYCGYNASSNYSAVADVALHDPHIQKYLRDGAVIRESMSGGPHYDTIRRSMCWSFPDAGIGLSGQEHNGSINETSRTVILPPTNSLTSMPSASVVNTTSNQQNIPECPTFPVNPPEFTCPREMQPRSETYTIHRSRPSHSKRDYAIPVDFPGVDRMTLINAVLGDPCVKEFSGAEELLTASRIGHAHHGTRRDRAMASDPDGRSLD